MAATRSIFKFRVSTSDACTGACSRHYGEWDSSSNQCKIHMYLSSINLRVYYDNTTESFQPDDPPYLWNPLFTRHASWLPSNSNFGCEPFSSSSNLFYYRDPSPWPPFAYAPTPSSRLSVSIRHYQDPFIVAASVTNGCSAATQSASSCFGRSIEEDRLIALVMIAIGVIGLTAGITVRE